MNNSEILLKVAEPRTDFFEQADVPDFAKAAHLLTTRRSIRRYLPEPVSTKTILDLLAIAITAPSAHNRQPWRFAVLNTGEAKTRLAQAMGERLRADRLADCDDAHAVDIDVRRSFDRITQAPAAIVVCTTVVDMDRYPDRLRNEAEKIMAIQGTAMAVQNLLVAAHAAGLGACWMCAPLFCPEVVTHALELPQDWEPHSLITMGWPANGGKPFSRRPISEIIRFA
ncbi:nitroreductase family protein [Trinickia mobilis]|uniref:nitroreductase family protein n=1 Tax=Trinickia mobilis TaxID=2816356 RepID=UPI001A8E6E4D|nr:nitroreductase family protein [Trinickia mobilis]